MKFLNPYNMTLDVTGYLNIIFMPSDVIEIAYFESIKVLQKYYSFTASKLFPALSQTNSAYARVTYSSPCRLHYFIPLTSIQGYSIVARNCEWYYTNLRKIFFFESRVTFLDNNGENIKTENITGGSSFLQIAIRGMT